VTSNNRASVISYNRASVTSDNCASVTSEKRAGQTRVGHPGQTRVGHPRQTRVGHLGEPSDTSDMTHANSLRVVPCRTPEGGGRSDQSDSPHPLKSVPPGMQSA